MEGIPSWLAALHTRTKSRLRGIHRALWWRSFHRLIRRPDLKRIMLIRGRIWIKWAVQPPPPFLRRVNEKSWGISIRFLSKEEDTESLVVIIVVIVVVIVQTRVFRTQCILKQQFPLFTIFKRKTESNLRTWCHLMWYLLLLVSSPAKTIPPNRSLEPMLSPSAFIIPSRATTKESAKDQGITYGSSNSNNNSQ